MIPINYTQIAAVAGLFLLSAFGFYALRLLSSFRTGVLARSWRNVSTGAIFLILAQFPLIGAGISSAWSYDFLLVILGSIMRFIGVLFLVIGLRAQCQVWLSESKGLTHRTTTNTASIEV